VEKVERQEAVEAKVGHFESEVRERKSEFRNQRI